MYHFSFSLFNRHCILSAFLYTICIILLPATGFSELVDKVVAVVNNDVITLSEVEEEAAGLYMAIARNNSGEPLQQTLAQARDKTLNALIVRKLIAQKAEQYHMSVSDKEIENGFEKVRARSSLSKPEFIKQLETSGMSEKNYRRNIKAQILQSKVVNFAVQSKIIITEPMILDYYDENYTYRVEKGNYYLLQIGFLLDSDTNSEAPDKTKERTLKRAERVHNLAVKGQDFRMLAKKFSDLPSASDSGDIGTFTLDEMAPFMRSAVVSLSPDDISDIVETDRGFQFFKLLSGDDNAIVVTASYEDVKDEIKQKLYQQKLKKTYNEWVEDLRNKAYIQKL
ncbi:MAG: SurA N-terminal domain-containing protein [Deltaproteobacteria bacterium]|nr:SurA N-terminal domain-containing protein [Deltaproteobacteria bacterium]MBW2658239.1 SurA N-terminal domain-containing protein [Deltaproteobacteria bacterium]